MGNMLIKRVLQTMKIDFPTLRTFVPVRLERSMSLLVISIRAVCQLSPVPGFRKWAEPQISGMAHSSQFRLLLIARSLLCQL